MNINKLIALLSLVFTLGTSFSSIAFAGEISSSAESEKRHIASKKSTTTGFMQEISEVRKHKGPNRSGKDVYNYRCQGCHGKNTQGAPLPDDTFEWQMRLNKRGYNGLMKHAMEGTKNTLMPPKGGCRDCNREEVEAALRYMLKTAGVKQKLVKKKIR